MVDGNTSIIETKQVIDLSADRGSSRQTTSGSLNPADQLGRCGLSISRTAGKEAGKDGKAVSDTHAPGIPLNSPS
jgi:hypothetical protein